MGMNDAVYGPNSVEVERLIERVKRLTREEATALGGSFDLDAHVAAWNTAGDTAMDAARDAGRTAARLAAADAAWDAARDATLAAWAVTETPTWDEVGAWEAAADIAWDTALAVVVRDLISKADFDRLTHEWVEAIGPTWEKGG